VAALPLPGACCPCDCCLTNRCCLARSAATLAQPTRKSLDGIKPFDSAGLRPEQLLDDVQTLPVVSAPSDLPHSVSAASLSSESDLALLLGATSDHDHARGSSTPLVFGTFPPVTVSLPAAAPADAQPEATSAADDSASADSKTATKLKATSHEFYPQAYLAAAAAATALAARTISSSISRSTSPATEAPAAPAAEQAEDAAEIVPAVAELAVTAAEHEQQSTAQQEVYPTEQMQHVEAEHQPQQAQHTQPEPSQQQYWLVQHQAPAEQQWQQPMTEQQWQEQQQWHHWQQQQQQQQQAQPQMVPMPVFVPVYVQPYPYPHYVQQHPQMHMMPVIMTPEVTAVASQHQQQQQLPQPQPMSVCPPSPGAYSLPADTCSLMSAATPAATPTGWQHSVPYGSSRPGSSASSVVSAYSSSRRQRQQQQVGEQAREAGTVTVSAMSCVKDAAGALAKVVTRHGNCLLLSLVKPGDAVAQATHVAAKSLAVARFYVNAHMAAAGAAGIDAAAALTGVEHTADAAAAEAVPAEAAAAAAGGAAVDDEVVFMPYHRSSSSSSSRPSDAADVPLGFVVAKASTRDLPVQLPPPVGIPACMQDKVQQQQQAGQQQRAAASASASGSSSGATLLKAGANTDVNKLSNAVIHNILGRWVVCWHINCSWQLFCFYLTMRSTRLASSNMCIIMRC